MNILVSACLLGKNCKYNGGNNYNQNVIDYIQGHTIISICPELLGGLGSPRESVEIVDGVFRTKNGKNVTKEFQAGVNRAMERISSKNIDLAILQSRSPTCGVNQIYDGTFQGDLIKGQGLFAKTLKEAGIKVTDCEDIKLS
ncbi:DUF523 domain-containing protein [Anaerotignum sp.]|uniref:DUF523 domain-containing protein n=1 Tax=Anaerotignum sp. TaxID=2039241 RepID=UPI00271527B8|nr:DUF523 domain-containing protein [Anaerotignum sp.]